MKSVAVIIPVRNEARFIARTLTAVLNQDFPPDQLEVLVVDGESTDETPAIVSEFCRRDGRVRLHSNPRRWSSAARNIGIQNSHNDLIVIVDGHCELTDRHYLTKLATAFQQSGADCLGRPQPQDVSQATPLQRAIAAARSSPVGHHPDSHIYSNEARFVPAHSVAVAYRREVFDKVGLFDEAFDACEDVELNHRIDRAQLKCYFTPEIMIRYEPRGTLRGLFRQLVRYGRGRIRLARKHSDTWSLKTLIPALFVAGLPLGAMASFFSKELAYLYVGTLVLYVLIILAGTVFAARQVNSWRAVAWIPLVFVVIHVAAGSGQWLELLFPRRRNPFS